jgi:Primase C terminal 2 (PriCT-2)
MTDTVTILQTKRGIVAAKRISLREGQEPQVKGYDNAKHFIVHERPVNSLQELAELLGKIEKERRYLIIRGRLLDGVDPNNALKRLHANEADNEPACFGPAARQWLPLDFDAIPCPPGLDPITDPEAAVRHLAGLLPESFHNTSCWWQHTSRAGLKPDIRMRLCFWASRAVTDDELKAWLIEAPIDTSIYNPVQAIYVANPIIEGGPDPVPVRSGIFRGSQDTVEVAPEIIGASEGRPEHPPGIEPRADIADIAAALRAIPNEDLSWERWNYIGMATSRASGGSDEGYALFEAFSRKSAKFDEAETRNRWESYRKSPPTQLGFGTLVHLAREAHPGWQIPSRSQGVSLDDFYAYMPMHNYIFAPARETWPAGSINGRLPPVFVGFDKNGEPKLMPPSQWLDQHEPVEQMTWAPGSPMIIANRLIADGGWIERDNVSCFNLYLPPNIEPGDASKAQPWLDHIGKIYPDDADDIIEWLAHRVQRPEEKINHALVLGGSQGIGKDSLLEPVKRAVGPWNFHEVSPQQIVGRFNGFLKSVILRINEARDLGDIDRF